VSVDVLSSTSGTDRAVHDPSSGGLGRDRDVTVLRRSVCGHSARPAPTSTVTQPDTRSYRRRRRYDRRSRYFRDAVYNVTPVIIAHSLVRASSPPPTPTPPTLAVYHVTLPFPASGRRVASRRGGLRLRCRDSAVRARVGNVATINNRSGPTRRTDRPTDCTAAYQPHRATTPTLRGGHTTTRPRRPGPA